MSTDFSSSNSQQKDVIQQIEQSRVQADCSLSRVSGSVETQKQVVTTTVCGMVSHVQTAVDKACVTVTHTSSEANKIFREVTSATVSVNDSAVSSMNHFTEFLDSTGDQVQREIGTHFTDLSGYLDTQKENIQSIDNTISSYATTVAATKVKVTGKTPAKTMYQPLRDLPVTREHDIIKNEVRRNPGLFNRINEVITESESVDEDEKVTTSNVDIEALELCDVLCEDSSSTGSEASLLSASRRDTKTADKDSIDGIGGSQHGKQHQRQQHDEVDLENIKPESSNKMPPPAVIITGSRSLSSKSLKLKSSQNTTTTAPTAKDSSSRPSSVTRTRSNNTVSS
jgi:hypothetical protein